MRNFIVILCSIILQAGYCQEIKDEQSKMERFMNQTSVITRFESHELPNLSGLYNIAEVAVRKMTTDEITQYFMIIEYKKDYSENLGSIAELDLQPLLNIIDKLEASSIADNLSPVYVENKFVAEDGFTIGYLVTPSSKTKVMWYLQVERYGGDTFFMKDITNFKTLVQSSIEQIHSLKG